LPQESRAPRSHRLGEHLDLAPERVEEAVAAEGSVLTVVDSLRASGRGLAGVQARRLREAESLIPESAIFDPEGPINPAEVITKALPTGAVRHSHQPIVRLGIVRALLALLGGLWHWTPLHDWISPSRLAKWTNAVAAWPLATLIVGAGITVGSLLMIPLTLLILQAAFLFGPLTGFLTAFTAAMVSAVVAFLIGRAVGRDGLQRLTTPRLTQLCRGLAHRGVLTVAAIRFLPVAPFTMVNMVLGAARIKLRHFTIGTAIGLAPGCLALSIFGDRLSLSLRHPDAFNVLVLALVAAALSLGGGWLVRGIQRRSSCGAGDD
jgi:phospholipase D1/2